MGEAMPERIWAGSCSAFGAPDTGYWYPVRTPSTPTEFIRADLVDELVKALEEARENMKAWQGYASDYMLEKHDADGDLRQIDAALTRIKGDGK